MGKYTNLEQLLTAQHDLSSIPDIVFTKNSGLKQDLENITALTSGVESYSVGSGLSDYNNISRNRLENGIYFERFEEIANAFAHKLHRGIESLKDIREQVSELTNKCIARSEERISKDPVLSEIYNIYQPHAVTTVCWDQLDIYNESRLRSRLHGSIDRDLYTESNLALIDMLVNKLPCANEYNEVAMERIKLEEHKLVDICARLHTKLPNMNFSVIERVVNNVLSFNSASCRVAIQGVRDFAEGKTVKNINGYMKNIRATKEILPLLTQDLTDLSASTTHALDEHISALNDITDVMAYVCYYYRNQVWKDAVLVPGGHVNRDNYEAYENLGGSTTAIVQHKEKFYNDIAIPRKGVSGAYIMKMADAIEEEFEQEVTRNITVNQQKKEEIERGAFLATAIAYLNDNRSKLSNKFAHHANVGKYAEAIYDGSPNTPVESKFYKLLLNSCYIGSIESLLYERLNRAYVDYAEHVGDLTSSACEDLNTSVYASLISEYLVDQGIIEIR